MSGPETLRFITAAITHLRDNGDFIGRKEFLAWGQEIVVNLASTPDPAQIRADALREAAALMEVAATNCRAAFTYPPRTKEERDYQTGALIHTYARNAILAMIDAPLSPTAVDNSPAPDAGMKGQKP